MTRQQPFCLRMEKPAEAAKVATKQKKTPVGVMALRTDDDEKDGR